MKRFSLLLLFAVVAMLLASASFASYGYSPIFNFPNVNSFDKVQYAPFQMKQGFEDKQLAWFICTDASDQQIACQTQQNGVFEWGLNFAPRLADLAGQVAIVYVVTNLQQGPVFTAVPGDPTYSGLWQIIYVTFKPGVLKHCINNADPFDATTNPNGLPSTSDAIFTTTNKAGNPIVVKYPIVAVGPLGGPWQPAPGNSSLYRIAQGKVDVDYTRTKIIYLPFWNIYCQDPINKHVSVRQMAIPDAFDPAGLPVADQLVPKLGANDAPGLGLINQMDTQAFYWQLGPQPMNQYPILQDCPDGWSASWNINLDYTPVETVVVLQRNVPPMAQSTVITNEPVLLDFLFEGCLTPVRFSQVIDGTVLPKEMMLIPIDGRG